MLNVTGKLPRDLKRLVATGDESRTMHNSAVPATLLGLLLALSCPPQPGAASETVAFVSGNKVLHGRLYRPPDAGPFRAILYNHGSAPGLLNDQAFDLIGPLFVARGWVFFAPYRRGQGLSTDAGPYIQQQIRAAQAIGGESLAAETMVRLLTTEQLQDQMAAFAWLKRQPFVRPTLIAAMGNSFGRIETVLGAEQVSYCAAVDASGGAESWDKAPNLQSRMLYAVEHAKSPILFFQAENDYSLSPSRTLYAAMKASHESAEIRIYPPYGSSPQQGHSFAYRGASIWFQDVLGFLEANCKPLMSDRSLSGRLVGPDGFSNSGDSQILGKTLRSASGLRKLWLG
jgi:carboxymethylenebutenolidase